MFDSSGAAANVHPPFSLIKHASMIPIEFFSVFAFWASCKIVLISLLFYLM